MKRKTQLNRMSEQDVAEYLRKAAGYEMQTSIPETDLDDGRSAGDDREVQAVYKSKEQAEA